MGHPAFVVGVERAKAWVGHPARDRGHPQSTKKTDETGATRLVLVLRINLADSRSSVIAYWVAWFLKSATTGAEVNNS
jgi:hypothetical protein